MNNPTRRAFLKSSLAATAATTLAAAGLSAAASPATPAGRDYYELRAYRLKPGAPTALLDAYLEKALLPALNARGISPVGVFTEIDVKDSAVWVLIPHRSLESVVSVNAALNADPAVQQAGAEYLSGPTKTQPAFDRIDSWLLLAFAGLPRLEVPATTKARQPRIFEMRMYESFSELKALKKVEMFNAGEIGAMKEVGLAPVFYGQALTGPNLPHLTYMTSGPDMDTHKQHWTAFGTHPVWVKLKNDPQYADTVSKITKRFLKPAGYSQI